MLKEIFVVTLKESILNVAKAWFTASKDISMDGKVYAVEQDEGKKKVIRNMLKGATSNFQEDLHAEGLYRVNTEQLAEQRSKQKGSGIGGQSTGA